MSHAEDADFGAWSHEYQAGDLDMFSKSIQPTLKIKGGKVGSLGHNKLYSLCIRLFISLCSMICEIRFSLLTSFMIY